MEAARSSSAGSGRAWATFVTRLPIVIRLTRESLGGVVLAPQTVLNLIQNLHLMMCGALILFFLVVEPEGLKRQLPPDLAFAY